MRRFVPVSLGILVTVGGCCSSLRLPPERFSAENFIRAGLATNRLPPCKELAPWPST